VFTAVLGPPLLQRDGSPQQGPQARRIPAALPVLDQARYHAHIWPVPSFTGKWEPDKTQPCLNMCNMDVYSVDIYTIEYFECLMNKNIVLCLDIAKCVDLNARFTIPNICILVG